MSSSASCCSGAQVLKLFLPAQLCSQCPLKLANNLLVRDRLARLILLDHLWLLIDHLFQHNILSVVVKHIFHLILGKLKIFCETSTLILCCHSLESQNNKSPHLLEGHTPVNHYLSKLCLGHLLIQPCLHEVFLQVTWDTLIYHHTRHQLSSEN